MDISKIDPNFKVDTNVDLDVIRFYDVLEPPFRFYGLMHEGGKFRRMPEAVAETVSPAVLRLHTNTAGGRVRFCTDSAQIAIHAEMDGIAKMGHFALTGSAGFDLYAKDNDAYSYLVTFAPPFSVLSGYQGIKKVPKRGMREYVLNFPLYANVKSLLIGIEKDASVLPAPSYSIEKPIVYYGSSITQGGCASRPGNSYQSILSRSIDSDYINLGFSGNAKAEDEIAEYIASLTMSAFVYDYDHNAPTFDHLLNTHERMYSIIHKKNPDLPILFLSRPKANLTEADKKRLDLITKNFETAKANGDRNLYLIPGPDLMNETQNDGTVDGTHPNDLGFHAMARAILPVLKKMLCVK